MHVRIRRREENRKEVNCIKVSKTFTDDEAEYMTQSATHHWLSIAGRANYEVTKTVTDDHAV